MTCRLTAILLAFFSLFLLGCGGEQPKGKSITEQYQAALKMGDPAQKAGALARVAEKQQKGGDGPAALNSIASAAAAAKEVTDPSSRANSLNTVAAAMCRLGDESGARELFAASATAVEEIQEPYNKITPLTNLAASSDTYLKSPEQGAEYLQKAETAAEAIADAVVKSQSFGKIAATYFKLGKESDAQRVADKGLEFAHAQSGAKEKATCVAEVAVGLARMKKSKEAEEAFDESKKLAESVESPDGKANALLFVGKKLKEAGLKENARAVLAKAEGVAEKLKDASIRGPLLTEIESAKKGL